MMCTPHAYTTEMTKYGWSNSKSVRDVLIFAFQLEEEVLIQIRAHSEKSTSLSELILDYWINVYGRYAIAHLEFRWLKVHHNDRYNFAWIYWVGNLYLLRYIVARDWQNMLLFLPIILFYYSSKFYLLFSLTLPIIPNKNQRLFDTLNDSCIATWKWSSRTPLLVWKWILCPHRCCRWVNQ